MHILLLKEILLLLKKIFTAADFEVSNTIVNNATATNSNGNVFGEEKLVIKNNSPFINCIAKINGIKNDNAEDSDVVIPMYNLPENSKNYRKTTGSLRNCYRDERNSDTDDNEMKHSIINSESFDYKANFMENGATQNNLTKNDVTIDVPLKNLSNFWRNLNIPIINCEVELILTWFKDCVLIDKLTRDADYEEPVYSKIDNPENAIFQITDTKFMFQLLLYQKKMI